MPTAFSKASNHRTSPFGASVSEPRGRLEYRRGRLSERCQKVTHYYSPPTNARGFSCVLPFVNSTLSLDIGAIAAANGLVLNEGQLQRLERYARLLVEWNAKVNLISRKDEANVFSRHILHSLTLAMPSVTQPAIPEGAHVFDLGTGGGLPGIPLKISRPDLTLVLCDSIQKKITAVSAMIVELKLSGISAVCGRAEELAKSSEKFDVIVCRAVAPLEDLVKWTRTITKPHGYIYALKGGDLSDEVMRAERLSVVQSITVKPLVLAEFDEFVIEEKKLAVVELV